MIIGTAEVSEEEEGGGGPREGGGGAWGRSLAWNYTHGDVLDSKDPKHPEKAADTVTD